MTPRDLTTHRLLVLMLGSALQLPVGCTDDKPAGDAGAGPGALDAGRNAPDSGSQDAPDAGGSTAGGPTDAGTDAGAAGGGTCDMGQVCDYACDANCATQCLGGLCTTQCPQGGCTADADFSGTSTLDCSGGGCHADCDNASSCAVDCSGGGCDVVCDVDSICIVTCSETGDPCNVSCENGGRAMCEGNCVVTGCDQTCEPDATYQPATDPKDFTTVIDNPLYPLPVGMEWILESTEEKITITVTKEKYKTASGVEALVVRDTVRSQTTDELIEDTRDYYAQDADGNVWYLGEDTAEYLNGAVASTAGSWEAGVDGAQPGIIMHAVTPDIGTIYRQEYYACEAEDMAEILEVDVSESVPAGDYTGCIRTRDFTPLEPGQYETKTFCPGVGNILVADFATGERLEAATKITMP